MASRTHRASFLQAFHSGISESQRKANIEAHNNHTAYSPEPPTPQDTSVTTYTPSTKGTKISDKMEKFILRLIDSRDIANLSILPNQTIDPKHVHSMSMSAGRALIDKLLNCPELPSNHSVRMPTQAQFNLMSRKNKEAGSPISETDIRSITFAEVNEFLQHMNTIIEANKKTIQETVKEGAYWYNGKIVRVQKSRQSNKLYAKIQIEGDNFEYAPGLITKLKPEDMLSIDDMKAFAQAYGQCGDCGRKLTHKVSIDRGIGPICSGKGYSN